MIEFSMRSQALRMELSVKADADGIANAYFRSSGKPLPQNMWIKLKDNDADMDYVEERIFEARQEGEL